MALGLAPPPPRLEAARDEADRLFLLDDWRGFTESGPCPPGLRESRRLRAWLEAPLPSGPCPQALLEDLWALYALELLCGIEASLLVLCPSPSGRGQGRDGWSAAAGSFLEGCLDPKVRDAVRLCRVPAARAS